MTEITVLLAEAKARCPGAEDKLWESVYEELRRIAGSLVARESREITLTGTALVHEAWLRVAGAAGSAAWDGRNHFFAAAAEAMRRILVDQARARLCQKRGGGAEHVSIEQVTHIAAPPEERLLQVHEVLDELARIDPIKATIVKLRYFVGYNYDEIASNLGLSAVTVRRHWRLARLWLYQRLRDSSRVMDAGGPAPEETQFSGT
jgi:RNA polymerase sigma factor (TIGR02999 family)